MTILIFCALGVFVAQTFLPVLFRYVLRKDPQLLATLGARDTPPETSVYGARSERALQNTQEAMIVFLPLALLGMSVDGAVLGAQLFVGARVAYVPAYILGIPALRSLIWGVGVFGLVLMALAVAGGA